MLSLALLAGALTGCGVGSTSNEGKVSKTASTYLSALADGDTAEACASSPAAREANGASRE